jgi:hypothetical protein
MMPNDPDRNRKTLIKKSAFLHKQLGNGMSTNCWSSPRERELDTNLLHVSGERRSLGTLWAHRGLGAPRPALENYDSHVK